MAFDSVFMCLTFAVDAQNLPGRFGVEFCDGRAFITGNIESWETQFQHLEQHLPQLGISSLYQFQWTILGEPPVLKLETIA